MWTVALALRQLWQHASEEDADLLDFQEALSFAMLNVNIQRCESSMLSSCRQSLTRQGTALAFVASNPLHCYVRMLLLQVAS